MAEKEGFEPSHGYPPNDLANRPLRPLGYFSEFQCHYSNKSEENFQVLFSKNSFDVLCDWNKVTAYVTMEARCYL